MESIHCRSESINPGIAMTPTSTIATVRAMASQSRLATRSDSRSARSSACSTVSRFFAGRATSLTVALAVLDKLKLKFEEVFTPINQDTA
jgi:hypothetical protein